MDYYNYAFNPSDLTGGSVRSRRNAFFRKTHLTPQFFRGKKVLEIGPGEGWDILTMVKSGARAVDSLDYSRGNVRNLGTRFRNYTNVRVIHGDAITLPFKANQFEFVYANGVIHHAKLTKIKKTIKEIHRILKKDGVYYAFEGMEDPKRQSFKDIGFKSLEENGCYGIFQK